MSAHGKVEKHSGQSGAQKHSRRYVDPDFRRRKRAEREALNDRYEEMCGPVTVTQTDPEEKTS